MRRTDCKGRSREGSSPNRSSSSDPYFHPYNAPKQPGFVAARRTRSRTSADFPALRGRGQGSYTIFEGTSEVQRLVIARAISGLHIR